MCTCKTSENSIPGNFSPKLELGEDALKNCLKEKKVTIIMSILMLVQSLDLYHLAHYADKAIFTWPIAQGQVLSKLIVRR